MRHRVLSAVTAVLLAGCSAQQVYSSGQAWQRNACDKLADMQERQRCLDKANASYETYRRQAEEVKGAK